MPVRTRFAPSPTGYLHIGGVRTALYNWLYARQNGGQFILRIDDTDAARNQPEALQPILEGLEWLGLNWDEGPCGTSGGMGSIGPHGSYFQSDRTKRYQYVVNELLDNGHAYWDVTTPESYAAMRKQAETAGIKFRYNRSGTMERRYLAECREQGMKPVVRLRMPTSAVCDINDMVRGLVSFNYSEEQDQILRRSDGTFTYHLATVVDDHDMEISHVIRAEEHLSNTPRQMYIYYCMGWDVPYYAHLPYVAEPGSKSKLSKRKQGEYKKNKQFLALPGSEAEDFNPVLTQYYQRAGFDPDVMLNYLLLLGWALDDKTETFTREDMLKHFSLERVKKSPASFDPKKLMAFQRRADKAKKQQLMCV